MKVAIAHVVTEALNKQNLLKGLLQYNYLPKQHDLQEELPPIFNSISFTPEVADELLKTPARKGEGYDVLPYKRTRHPNIPRMMGIPHPRPYAQLVSVIANNWETSLSELCNSPNSEIEFSEYEDGRIVIQRYGHVDGEGDEKDALLNFGKRYKIKTDITNFYHSIYSHAIPWALVGQKEAKKHKGPAHKDKWYNQIDYAVTQCQRSETKGVAIGPATSNIISELILFRVDEKLREKGYVFSRFVDDYKCYTKTQDEADKFLVDLAACLNEYVLSLNPKKTQVLVLPQPQKAEWVTELNLYLGGDTPEGEKKKFSLRRIKLIIDKAIALSNLYPDGSVLKYALSAILDHGVEGDDASEYLEDNLLRLSYHFPSLIPLIQRGLKGQIFYSDFLQQRLMWLFEQSLDHGQSDNIVWCLYYLLKTLSIQVKDEHLKKAWETEDPIVMLMAYLYAKRNKRDVSYLKKWVVEKNGALKKEEITNYDIDRLWLVFYQLYYDKVSDMPYIDANENKVFEVLRSKKVSFIDEDNEDLLAHSNFIKSLFSKVKSIGEASKKLLI